MLLEREKLKLGLKTANSLKKSVSWSGSAVGFCGLGGATTSKRSKIPPQNVELMQASNTSQPYPVSVKFVFGHGLSALQGFFLPFHYLKCLNGPPPPTNTGS